MKSGTNEGMSSKSPTWKVCVPRRRAYTTPEPPSTVSCAPVGAGPTDGAITAGAVAEGPAERLAPAAYTDAGPDGAAVANMLAAATPSANKCRFLQEPDIVRLSPKTDDAPHRSHH